MEKDIKISIIIPVYNAEKNLNRLIVSILCQSFKPYELLLIDDGSNDNSPQICDTYALKYDKVLCIHQKNQGVSKARNAGLKIATGNYIAFIDSDDNIDKDYLKNLVDNIHYNENIIVIGGYRIIHYGYNLNEKRFLQNKILNKPDFNSSDLSRALELGLLNSTWGKLFSSKTVENLYYDTEMNFAEDTCFLLSALSNCNKIVFSEKCYYTYVCGEGLSGRNTLSTCKSLKKYFECMYNFESDNLISNDEWERALSDKISNEIFSVLKCILCNSNITGAYTAVNLLLSNPRTSYLVKIFLKKHSNKLKHLKMINTKFILYVYVTLKKVKGIAKKLED